jgi:predicted dehydrogenase
MIKRVLIVGFGSIGQRHLKLVREFLPLADIKILRHKYDPNLPFGVSACLSSIEEAIAFAPQIAVLANPAPWHMPVGVALSEIGCHLLVEKPLADRSASAQKLIQACRDAKCILQVGYNLRFLPSLCYFKKALDERLIGDIFSIRCEVGQYLPAWRNGKDYRESVSAQQKMGGGVLLELSHELDYLLWCFGAVKWVSAVLSQQSNLEIDVEDYAHLTLGFEPKGKRSTIASLNLDFFRLDTKRTCYVIGERGTLQWDGVSQHVALHNTAVGKEILFAATPDRDESYRAQFQYFLNRVAIGYSLDSSVQDALEVMRVIGAALKSHAAQASKVFIKNEHYE